MAARNIKTDKKTSPGAKKPASSDSLIKGGKPELSEDEPKDVSGGAGWDVKHF